MQCKSFSRGLMQFCKRGGEKCVVQRREYNDRVWNRLLQRRVVNKKIKRCGLSFHHNITTDGVRVCTLNHCWKVDQLEAVRSAIVPPARKKKAEINECSSILWCGSGSWKKEPRHHGDQKSDKPRVYTPIVKGDLTKYTWVLQKEKEKHGITTAESKHSHRMTFLRWWYRDEYRTSKMCNVCYETLSRYKTKKGTLSYSRLQ